MSITVSADPRHSRGGKIKVDLATRSCKTIASGSSTRNPARQLTFANSQVIIRAAFIWFVLLLSLSGVAVDRSSETAPVRIEGSYVIAAICRDGIMVASDSRGTLKDKQGRRVAYYDVNQKIFPMGRSLIADTGYSSLNDPNLSFLSALMAHFADSPRSHTDVDQLPASYFSYLDVALSAPGVASARVQTLVFAGFKTAGPMLCVYRGETNGKMECQSSGYLSSPRARIGGLAKVGTLSFGEAARAMQQEIESYAAAIQPGPVGGPVVIRVITPSESKWWGQPPHWPNWNSFTDLAGDYRAGLVAFHLMPGVDKAELDALIAEGAAWSRPANHPATSQ